MFQFGYRGVPGNSNYFELSDKDSSSVPFDPEVETEFSRLRDNGTFDGFGIKNIVARNSTNNKPNHLRQA